MMASSLSKREIFLSTFRRNQAWPLPDSIIYYITKNPSSSKCYKMLIKSCKYFFVKNPLLVVSSLSVENYNAEWNAYSNNEHVNLQNIISKIWITNEITVENVDENPNDQYFFTTILPRIYKSDILKFTLTFQNIVLDDLILLASRCEIICLRNITVKDVNGVAVTLERIIEALPNIKDFYYHFEDTKPNIITSKTVQNMVRIPHFLTLKYLDLIVVPGMFDLEDFFSYITKNNKTKIYLEFSTQISDGYKQRLQSIVNDIVQMEDHGYKVPYIIFPDNDPILDNKLWKLYFG